MKTAKARVLLFDLECPHCGDLLASVEGDGSCSWSIHESAPLVAVCECGQSVKVPARVPGAAIVRDLEEFE